MNSSPSPPPPMTPHRAVTDTTSSREGRRSLIDNLSALPDMAGRPGRGLNTRTLSLALEQPDLLRAVTSMQVLEGFGRLFKKSKGDAEGMRKKKGDDFYAKSKPTDKINKFISHSWSAGQWSKFVALLFHFNLGAAIGMSCFSVLVVAVVILAKKDASCVPVAIEDFLPLVGAAVFLLTLFFGQRLSFGRLCGCQKVFLDRCCVHQTDQALKREGIESIGGFIFRSDEFVLLWTPDFFQRLWCAYEVACFLKLKVAGKMEGEDKRLNKLKFVHVSMQTIALYMFMLNTVVLWVYDNRSIRQLTEGDSDGSKPAILTCTFQYTAVLLLSFVFAPFALRFARDHTLLFQQLQNFSLADAKYSVPSDRALVMGSIEVAWGGLKAGKNGLEAFELFVHGPLYRRVKKAALRVPWRLVLVISLPMQWRTVGMFVSRITKSDSEESPKATAVVICECLFGFTVCAVFVFTVLTAARHWRWPRYHWAFGLLVSVGYFAYCEFGKAMRDPPSLGLIVAFTVFQFLALVYLARQLKLFTWIASKGVCGQWVKENAARPRKRISLDFGSDQPDFTRDMSHVTTATDVGRFSGFRSKSSLTMSPYDTTSEEAGGKGGKPQEAEESPEEQGDRFQ